MVDQAAHAIDTLDEELFKGWYKRGMQLVVALETGLNKIDFGMPLPEEIIKLQELINQAKHPDMLNQRKQLLNLIGEIGKNLENLHQKKDLGDLQANNFLFQASRTFNRFSKPHRLNLFLINEFFKYGKAFINPANKPSENTKEEPLPFMADYVLKKGAKFGVEEIDGIFDFHVGSFFERQAHSMHSVKLNNITDRAEKQSSLKFLANQLGTTNYAAFQKTSDLAGVNDVEKMLSEKIYGFSYEFYYSQVAMYLDTLHQIEQVASMQPTPRQSQETRAALLKKYGVAAIDSPEGKNFLNSISTHLGFSDAQNLYDNYKDLAKKPEAFETLLAAKNKFCDFAVKPDGFREQDPIEQIKGIYENEYQRIQGNKKNNEFYLSNSTYISTVSYMATDFMLAIDGVRKARNIAGVAIHDELAPRVEGQNDGILMNMAKNVANYAVNNLNLKDWVDVNQYLGLNAHGVIVEGRIDDARNQVQQQLLELRAQQVALRQKGREKLFNQMIGEKITQEKLVVNYEKNMVVMSESEKRDYQAIFTVKAELNCQGKSKDALEKLVSKYQGGLESAQALHAEHKKEQLALNSRKEKFERKEASFGGKWSRFTDGVASFFGVKTKSAQNREKEAKYIESQTKQINNNMTSIEARIEGYTKVLGMTKEQLVNLKRVESLDETNLLKEYHENVKQLSNIIKELVSEYKEKPSIDYEKMLEMQGKYFAIQNKILLDKQVIISRLSTFDLEQINQLISVTNNLNSLQKTVKPELLGLTSQVTDFYGQKINGYASAAVGQKAKLEEQQQQALLEAHKNTIQTWVQSQDITNLKTLLADNRPKDLSASHLQSYDSCLQEQVIQKIKTETQGLSLDKVNALHEMVSRLHFVSPNIQVFDKIRSELDTRLNHGYASEMQAGFERHRKLLIHSTQSISDTVQNLEKSQQEADSLKSTYESWLMNPFGFRVEKQKLDESNANVESYQAILSDTLVRNREVVQEYIANQMPAYHKKPIKDLETDLEWIKQQIEKLQQLPKDNFTESTKIAIDDLIQVNQNLLEKLNDQHQTYFEKLLNSNEQTPMPLLSQALVEAAKNGRVDLLDKIIKRAGDDVFPEVMVNQALKESIKNQHPETMHWILTHLDVNMDRELTNVVLSQIDMTQTNVSPYQKGMMQMLVDNDGYVLEEIRKAYAFQESSQKTLNKEIEQNKQDTQSLNVVLAKLSKIIAHREQMVSELSKTHLDNPERVTKQIAKWNSEIENKPEDNTSKLIIDALNEKQSADFESLKTLEPEPVIPDKVSIQTQIVEPESTKKPEKELKKEPEIDSDKKADVQLVPEEPPVIEPEVKKPKKSQAERREKYLNLKAYLMEHITKRPWEGSKFKLLLSELRDYQEKKQPNMQNDFNNTMIKIIEKLTKKSEAESLEIAIEFMSDPAKQQEAVHHALIHAIQLGKTDVLKVLLHRNIDFSEKNQNLSSQIMDSLLSIAAEKNAGMAQSKHIALPKMIAQLLPMLPVSDNEKTHELINLAVKEERNGQNYPIETGTWQRWVADSDKPILEEYRGIYLFEQQVLKELANDSSYELRMPMDNLLIDKLITEFTPDEIKKYQDLVDSLQQKLDGIEQKLHSFKEAQFEHLDKHQKGKVQNQDRLKNHLGNWDGQLAKGLKSRLAEVQSDINHVKEQLAEYHQYNKDNVVLSDKKQVLFGYSAASAEPAESKNTLDNPEKKNISKISPPSGQG